MSIAYDFEGAHASSETVIQHTHVELQAWGARLRDPEVPVALLLKGVGLHVGAFALMCLGVLQWTNSSITWTPEIALIKLALTSIAFAGAVVMWYGAKRARPTMFDVDIQSRELRTLLANSTNTVLEVTRFDDLEDVYVASSDGCYVLAYTRRGAKTAEILAHGGFSAMQRLEQTIVRALA